MEQNDKHASSEISENLDSPEELAELTKSIESLEETISTTNSNNRVIWRGILTGLSGAIGATIIFGLLVTLISGILYNTGMFPELNEFLNSLTNKNN